MAASKASAMPTGVKPKNKLRRQSAYTALKKSKEAEKRDARFRRKREEEKDPSLREERRARNVPVTIDAKRTWDGGVGDEEDALGWAVDVERLAKKRKLGEEEQGAREEEGILAKLKKLNAEGDGDGDSEVEQQEQDEEADSMLDSDSDVDDDISDSDTATSTPRRSSDPPKRASSPATSTATNLELSPEFLKQKFPTLFQPPAEPKILVTTSLNSTLHHEAHILTSLLPNSTYIRRSAHAHAHKYSVREIAQFASNRSYTTLIILMEDQKRPSGLDIVHLPSGPHFHFTITNWVEGKKLPGHGNPTGHIPELILNNFRTPLGLLTAHLFQSLYPTSPEIEGRTVVTLHNQRDYIFVRRHRYIFRDKRESEKSIVGTDGKAVKGVEDIRTGLQELGPRFTLKLRRVDRGVQWKSGQEWEWKSKMEKQRTRFNM
ncbi:Brix-domain-containing protein [Lindgomyces ingoldianus]|uniref:Brix-domain-containing protein n=1 Tax=Lindgomyces ingoldianus TaxID=673940 RepID=A0ACB6Q9Z1_9PLEO|nr:Brix-domain-containing protein [Lindgomyces ingoldianus]KAF2463710.1 Brix-domain-containing protein [Lindgomyces ingoldianus]